MKGMVRDVEDYQWLAHALLVGQGEKSQSLNLILTSARHEKAREFLELKQGTMTVLKYVVMWPQTWPK